MEALIFDLVGVFVMTGIAILKFIGFVILLCATYGVGRFVAGALFPHTKGG